MKMIDPSKAYVEMSRNFPVAMLGVSEFRNCLRHSFLTPEQAEMAPLRHIEMMLTRLEKLQVNTSGSFTRS
jgi:hypothetical protein